MDHHSEVRVHVLDSLDKDGVVHLLGDNAELHMAKACGMEAVQVSDIAAFGDAVRAALKRKGPFLIEALF